MCHSVAMNEPQGPRPSEDDHDGDDAVTRPGPPAGYPQYPTYPGQEQPSYPSPEQPPPPPTTSWPEPPPTTSWPAPPTGQPAPAYQPPPGVPYVAAPHPRATTAMVLGIVGVAGGFLCYLPILLAPFAWVMGGRAVREIDASQGTMSGRGEAQAGRILGIVGTVLLILGLLALAGFIALLVADPTFLDEEY